MEAATPNPNLRKRVLGKSLSRQFLRAAFPLFLVAGLHDYALGQGLPPLAPPSHVADPGAIPEAERMLPAPGMFQEPMAPAPIDGQSLRLPPPRGITNPATRQLVPGSPTTLYNNSRANTARPTPPPAAPMLAPPLSAAQARSPVYQSAPPSQIPVRRAMPAASNTYYPPPEAQPKVDVFAAAEAARQEALAVKERQAQAIERARAEKKVKDEAESRERLRLAQLAEKEARQLAQAEADQRVKLEDGERRQREQQKLEVNLAEKRAQEAQILAQAEAELQNRLAAEAEQRDRLLAAEERVKQAEREAATARITLPSVRVDAAPTENFGLPKLAPPRTIAATSAPEPTPAIIPPPAPARVPEEAKEIEQNETEVSATPLEKLPAPESSAQVEPPSAQEKLAAVESSPHVR